MSAFWAWFADLAWWQYVLIAYVCAAAVDVPNYVDDVFNASGKRIREDSPTFRALIDQNPLLWTALSVPGFLLLSLLTWPYFASGGVKRWWRALGMKVPPKREDTPK